MEDDKINDVVSQAMQLSDHHNKKEKPAKEVAPTTATTTAKKTSKTTSA